MSKTANIYGVNGSGLASLRFAALSSHLKLKEEGTVGGRALGPDTPKVFKWLHSVKYSLEFLHNIVRVIVLLEILSRFSHMC